MEIDNYKYYVVKRKELNIEVLRGFINLHKAVIYLLSLDEIGSIAFILKKIDYKIKERK